jgi:hypothetical protein
MKKNQDCSQTPSQVHDVFFPVLVQQLRARKYPCFTLFSNT